jgi:hypothetical protein
MVSGCCEALKVDVMEARREEDMFLVRFSKLCVLKNQESFGHGMHARMGACNFVSRSLLPLFCPDSGRGYRFAP